MDQELAKLALAGLGYGATFVGKAAFSFASSMALKKITTFVDDKSKSTKKLSELKKKLDSYLNVLIPIIDMIELAVARGCNSLETALELTNELNHSISILGLKIEDLPSNLSGKKHCDVVDLLIFDLEKILQQTVELIPILQLSVSVSGVSFSNKLDNELSPNRLLQASSYLTTAFITFNSLDKVDKPIRVGPAFPVKMYSLFEGSARKSDVNWTWEDFIKSNVEIIMDISDASNEKSNNDKYSYFFQITEDLNDGRYHDESQVPKQRKFPVLDISKTFYTCSGKLLNIEDSSLPVLILKVQQSCMNRRKSDAGSTPNTFKNNILKTEWLAFELMRPSKVNESEEDENDQEDSISINSEIEQVTENLKKLSTVLDSHEKDYDYEKKLSDSKQDTDKNQQLDSKQDTSYSSKAISLGHLCLLEYLIKLSCLEITEGKRHTECNDQILCHYLNSRTEPALANSFISSYFDKKSFQGGIKRGDISIPLKTKLIDRFLSE